MSAEAPGTDDTGTYRAIFEANRDAVFVHDGESMDIVDANPAAARLTGMERSALVGRSVDEFSAVGEGFDLERAAAAMREALDTGEHRLEWKLSRPDGEVRWVDVSLDGTTIDGESRVLAFVHDVTAHKRREMELERQQNSLQDLYDVMTDAELDVDSQTDRLLEIGCERLGLRYGFVTRIAEESQYVEHARGGHTEIRPDVEAPLSESYCRHTVAADSRVTQFDDATESLAGDPALDRFEFGCYVAAKLAVEGETYGTICFADDDPRPESFRPSERLFVDLLAQLLSRELERERMRRRIQAERDLKDRILDITPTGIGVVDESGRVELANEQAKSLLGMSESELVGAADEELALEVVDLDGEPLDPSQYPSRRVSAAGEHIRDDQLGIVSGEESVPRFFSVSGAPLELDGERKAITVFDDITDRLEREAELRARKEHLETVTEHLPIILFAVDPAGRFTLSRGRALELVGLTAGEVVGESAFEVYADVPDVLDAIERALDGESVRSVVDFGTTVFDTQYRPIFDESGAVEQVIGVALDVTEEQRRKQLQLLFDRVPDPIYVIDTDGNIDDVNEVAVEHLGYTAEEFRGMSISDIEVDLDREQFEAVRSAVDAAGDAGPIEGRHRRADGTEFPVTVRISRYETGGEQQYVCLARDVSERDERERELEEARERLKVALEGTDTGVWEWEIESGRVHWSETLERLVGLEPGSFEGTFDAFVDRVHEDDVAGVRATVEDAIEHGTLYEEQLRLRTTGGEYRWVETRGYTTTRDETLQMVGIVTDISEERRRQQAFLEEIGSVTTAGVWEVDLRSDTVEWTDEIYRIHGVPPDYEPTVEEGIEFYHPADRPKLVEAFERVQETGEPYDLELRIVRRDGEITWVQSQGKPRYDDDGELIGVRGTFYDIEQRKRRELRLEALSESIHKLIVAKSVPSVAEQTLEIAETVLGQPVTALWKWDAEADRLVPWKATAAAEEAAGAGGGMEPMTPGTHGYELFHRGDPEMVEDYQSLANVSHPDVPLGGVLFLPIGEYGLLSIGSPTAGAFDQTDQNLLSILADNATAAFVRAEREAALERYRDRLEQSNENLQEFAYIASHDLQEPIRGISSYLDLLQSEYGDRLDGDAETYIDVVLRNTDRMRSMIDALLQYSRVETKGRDFETVDTETVVADSLEALELLVHESSAEVSVGSLPTVVADGPQLGQVFQNLVKNAITHGGDPPRVELWAEEREDEWSFAVSDNGPGVPEPQRERIFEIFQQGSSDGEGTGIGLAICERIVSRHGGRIWVEDGPEGSIFRFTLSEQGEEAADPLQHATS